MEQVLCKPATVEGITAARVSVETYLGKLFDEINELQEADKFLQNVESIQQKSHELETWQVQREQLSATESCAKACTCDEGAKLVIQEYNQLAAAAPQESGLKQVPLAMNFQWWWVGLVVVVALVWLWWRKRT